jgi:hypothetical protein
MKLLDNIVDLFFPPEPGDPKPPPKQVLIVFLMLLFILLWGTCR